MVIPLFQHYPELRDSLPYRPLGSLPTPVQPLSGLAAASGAPRLYVKRDDLSGLLYGGNKLRKLEFLLARILADGAGEVMTFGAAGSNHVLATSIYARELGLQPIAVLSPQANARYVQRNLLAVLASGAELHALPSAHQEPYVALAERLRHAWLHGQPPAVIRLGGSTALGTVGFVNAAFELKAQVEAGELPEPDLLYVALGTMGTAVGLCLGLKAAGMKTRVIPVRVVHERVGNRPGFEGLFRETNALLHRAAPAFPTFTPEPYADAIRHEFYGGRYAVFTPEGIAAIGKIRDSDGLQLEGTYTGKAMAAMLEDLKIPAIRGRCVLFWNTSNSRPLESLVSGVDYRRLPPALLRYFQQDVQPLDRPDGP